MIMLPMAMIGAGTTMFTPNEAPRTPWICWMLLVVRVISDGVPKVVDLGLREALMAEEGILRTSRLKPMETLKPQYTATMAAMTKTSVTASMRVTDLEDVGRVAGDHARCRRCRR